MRFNVHSNFLRLIREGGKWGDGYLYSTTFSLHCHHQNDFALRWAAVWDIVMFHWFCGQSHKTRVHKAQILKRKESRSGSNRGPSTYQPCPLPLGHTGSSGRETERAITKLVCLNTRWCSRTPHHVTVQQLGRVTWLVSTHSLRLSTLPRHFLLLMPQRQNAVHGLGFFVVFCYSNKSFFHGLIILLR